MKIDSAKVCIGVVSLAIGFMLSIQLSANFHNSSNISFKKWAKQEALIENMQKENDTLLNEVIMLRNKLALESSSEQSEGFNERFSQVNIAAGFTPVMGSGIIIHLDDNLDPLRIGDNPDDYIIHDKNLLFVVNDLKGSGAEAISINGQRIIATSEMRCAGPTILVNTTRVTPPFEIKAIGNPDNLESLMRTMDGELQLLEMKGIKISIEKSDKVEIPALNGVQTYYYARSG